MEYENRKKVSIEELVKQYKLINELDDYSHRDLVFTNIENFYDQVRELTTEEYQKLAAIIWPKD